MPTCRPTRKSSRSILVDETGRSGCRVPLRGTVDLVRCRVPARRPGNFGVRITSLREVSGPPLREHLLAQMKVTKAKGLNTDLVGVDGCKLERSLMHRRTSACFLADPSSLRDFIGRKSPLQGRRRFDALTDRAARSGMLVLQPSKFEPPEIRSRPAASKSTRKRSEPRGDDKPRALTQQMSGQIRIQALCLGPAPLKVNRPPGRNPGHAPGAHATLPR